MRNGLVLVDAYNGACCDAACQQPGRPFGADASAQRSLTMPVINKWPKCAVHFVAGNLAAAREALINEVLGYAAFRGKLCAQH